MRRLLSIVKRYPALYNFLRLGVYARLRSFNRRRVFLNVYRTYGWGQGTSVSGPGSSLEATVELRNRLPQLIIELGIRSLLDIPCGDLEWMKHVDLGVERYIGGDIVGPLIRRNREEFGGVREFLNLDLIRDLLPTTDALLCRDCLVHLSFREIRLALANIRRAQPTYVMLTTFPGHEVNVDTVTPYWRALNMQGAPFSLPEPAYLIKDFSPSKRDDEGKYLGIWRLNDLQPTRPGPGQ